MRVLALFIWGFVDFGLALHAGGDFPCGVEFLVEGVAVDGLEGEDELFLVLGGGVSWERKVGGVARGVRFHLPQVLVGVHEDCGSSLVCWEDGDVWDGAEVLEGLDFLFG